MKIYFSAAISQRDQYGKSYERIVSILEGLGHTVQHEHITRSKMDEILNQTDQQRTNYYKQALRWISKADVVVVEASFPSTMNVGHEITLALEKGKVVVVLYHAGRSSFFLHGLTSDKLLLVEYSDDNLDKVLVDAIEYAKESADTRFNFFISPRHINYLDWIAKSRKIPRSVYLRDLIERDKERNAEYNES